MSLMVFFSFMVCLSSVNLFTIGLPLMSLVLILGSSGPTFFGVSMYEMQMKMDTVSFFLVFLTWFTVTSSLLVMGGSLPKPGYKNKIKLVLILGVILYVSFMSDSALIFYMFFEVSVVPVFMIVMGWGYQPERGFAALSLFFYTVTAAMPIFISLIGLFILKVKYMHQFSKSLIGMLDSPLMLILSLSFMLAFLVKLPVFGAHLWLPKAHVEAPLVGSMILAAIMLKLGGYGMIRFAPMFSGALEEGFMIFSLFGGVLISLTCLAMNDLKVLIAYSSVSHMSFVVASVMSGLSLGVKSSMIVMISHGLSSSGMFLFSYMIYEVSGSRNLILSKGAISYISALYMPWVLMIMSNMGTPPSYNFMGEISSAISVMSKIVSLGVVMAVIMFLTTGYSALVFSGVAQGKKMESLSSSLSINSMNLLIMSAHLFLVYALFILKLDSIL